MLNLIHLIVLFLTVLAYILSDVNSSSSFLNTFLPFIVLLGFIYGVLVTINILYRLRGKSDSKNKSADILLASIKEHGLSAKAVTATIAQSAELDSQLEIKISQESAHKKRQGNKVTADFLSSSSQSVPGLEPDQESINRREWTNPDNWSGSSLFPVYFSKDDSRIWVAKKIPLLGYTLNLANRSAVFWRYLLWLVVMTLVTALFDSFIR